MRKMVTRMTQDELRQVIEVSLERKLRELLGDPDVGLKLRATVRRQLSRQRAAVAAGERGHALDAVARRLELG